VANEQTETVRVKISNDNKPGFEFNSSRTVQLDQTSTDPDVDDRKITVTVAETDLVVDAAIGTPGVMLITNLEAKGGNFITYGPKSGASMVALFRLNPQETHKVRLASGVTLRWAADTANVDVQLQLAED
tara:strand:- start:106 stop:495 length:390 start_codon:yes stop_codon:yes gene_type:complete